LPKEFVGNLAELRELVDLVRQTKGTGLSDHALFVA
jgi:hypothetical protein